MVICFSFIKSGVRHQKSGRVQGHLRLGRIEGVSSSKSNPANESYDLWNFTGKAGPEVNNLERDIRMNYGLCSVRHFTSLCHFTARIINLFSFLLI